MRKMKKHWLVVLVYFFLAAQCGPMEQYPIVYHSSEQIEQFYLPHHSFTPKGYWYVVHTDYANREDPGKYSAAGDGLQGYLLMHSVVGLINKAAVEGKIDYCAWMEKGDLAYDTERALLGTRLGDKTAIQMVTDPQFKSLFEGYVLTDLKNNPESGNIAAVASHVYNALIADVGNEQFFIDAGYTLKCDCRNMTLAQAFEKFKDQCNRNALVLMPVGVSGRTDIPAGELRDYAIANRLFVVNLVGGKEDNAQVFNEILEWLTPASQVLGWENNNLISEDKFIDPISRHGHLMLAADWSYNHTLTSRDYVVRQPSEQAKGINPRKIQYDQDGNFLSFFSTDGDSYQFITTDAFVNDYYTLPSSSTTKIAFELGSQSLIQLAPTRFSYLFSRQPSPECTIMETFGGGYYYIDTFATEGTAAGNRADLLKTVAARAASHMRQHGIKILHVMAKDFSDPKGQEMLQAFVDANDQLEGITGVEYNPYDGGAGKIYWFTNKAGFDIPLITTKYMLWDGLFSPAQAAQKANAGEPSDRPSFNTVAVHAWSIFNGKRAANAAQLMMDGLDDRFHIVSVQELIWRLRMQERGEQTRKILYLD